jgi:hypothetical protein
MTKLKLPSLARRQLITSAASAMLLGVVGSAQAASGANELGLATPQV